MPSLKTADRASVSATLSNSQAISAAMARPMGTPTAVQYRRHVAHRASDAGTRTIREV